MSVRWVYVVWSGWGDGYRIPAKYLQCQYFKPENEKRKIAKTLLSSGEGDACGSGFEGVGDVDVLINRTLIETNV